MQPVDPALVNELMFSWYVWGYSFCLCLCIYLRRHMVSYEEVA